MRLFLVVFLASLSFPALAQQCHPRADALATLSIQFDEHVLLVGKTESGAIVEVFSSPNGETFTLLVTRQRGNMLCSQVVGAGEDLSPVPFSVGTGS